MARGLLPAASVRTAPRGIRVKRLLLSLTVAWSACGGDSPTHVTLRGEPSGFKGTEASWALLNGTAIPSDGSPSYPATWVEVTIGESPGTCARFVSRSALAKTTNLTLTVSHGTSDPIPTGRYEVRFDVPPRDSTPTASVSLVAVDGSCNTSTWRRGTDGAVTLSSISAEEVSGSVEVSLDDGTRLVGQFVGLRCSAVGPGSSPDGAPPECIGQ